MKRTLIRAATLILALILAAGLAGCGVGAGSANDDKPSGNAQTQESTESADDTADGYTVDGLPQGFPEEIPLYTGAELIEADNYNGNHYTVLYVVTADYEEVVDFYMDAFNLDDSGLSEDVAYYEGFEFGDILINGLTIEDADGAVNVYMTLRDDSQDSLEYEDDGDYSDEYGDSDIITYDDAEEVSLDSDYPRDVVPVHPDAKIIGCSMVPGTRSGFVDLILPADAFENAVSFYADELGVEPDFLSTVIQEAAQLEGKADNIEFSIFISHLLSDGNDTLIQITVNEE